MSGATAGQRMGKSAEEGQALMDKFFGRFSKLYDTIEHSQQELRKLAEAKKNDATLEDAYVEDWVGRKRHLPEAGYKAYEVSLVKPSPVFNPFIQCDNEESPVDKALIAKYEEIIKKTVEASNDYQDKIAKREGRTRERNDEMSNAKYKALAAEAIQDGVIIKANTGRRAKALRQCFNARIQGGAASLTKVAMVDIFNDKRLKAMDAHLIITVHDEVLVECPEIYADEVEKILPEIMIEAAKKHNINVPMKCDPYNVSRWYCDEYAAAILDEFSKLEKNGLDKETALAQIYKSHSEVPQAAILKTVETGCDLEF